MESLPTSCLLFPLEKWIFIVKKIQLIEMFGTKQKRSSSKWLCGVQSSSIVTRCQMESNWKKVSKKGIPENFVFGDIKIC